MTRCFFIRKILNNLLNFVWSYVTKTFMDSVVRLLLSMVNSRIVVEIINTVMRKSEVQISENTLHLSMSDITRFECVRRGKMMLIC